MSDNRFALIKEFFYAIPDTYSYNLFRNTYIWFGIAWGLVIPVIFLLLLEDTIFQSHLQEDISTSTLSSVGILLLALPILFGLLFGILGTIRMQKEKKLHELIQQLRSLSNKDALTGLYNRRRFNECFSIEKERTERSGTPLSLLLIDLDHFKRINDDLGHNVGDDVLRNVGTFLKHHCRPYDSAARWGGEEFIVLLPRTTELQAVKIAERIRLELSDLIITTARVKITASFGVSQYYTEDSLETFTERADRALYAAKSQGRNKTVAWSSLSPME